MRYIESFIDVQWGQENPNPRAHRSSGEKGLPLNGGHYGWDFFFFSFCSVTIDSFSHIPFSDVLYEIFADDITELMFTFNDARCTKSA